MGKRNGTEGSAATDDGSIEVKLMSDGWTPIVIFKGGDQSSFVRRAENNVAWMLQTLLDSGSKVDTLYETCRNDHRTLSEAKALLGSSAHSDITIVQITGKSQRWQNVRAVGVNGKRSHIFALIVALGMTSGYNKVFKHELEKYGLAKGLLGLIDQLEALQNNGSNGSGDNSWISRPQEEPDSRSWSSSNFREDSSKNWKNNNARPIERRAEGNGSQGKSHAVRIVRRSPARRSPVRRSPSRGAARRSPVRRSPSRGAARHTKRQSSPDECSKIEVRMVCESVPVINTDCDHPFTIESVSNILSWAMAQEKPADYLLEFIHDAKTHPFLQKVQRACEKELQLDRKQIRIVKVADVPLTEVLGVGTTGRLSSILAAIIAIALRDEGQLEDIRDFFEDKHPHLEKVFYELIARAVELKERANHDEDDRPSDNNGEFSTEATTWDPYMAAEAGVWNRSSTRGRPTPTRHRDASGRILMHLTGRSKRGREMSRSRSGRRR